MKPLDKDLQERKYTLQEFRDISIRVLEYLPNVLSGYKEKKGYRIHSSIIAGTRKFVRPINQKLFIYSPTNFKVKYYEFEKLLKKLNSENKSWANSEKLLIDSVLYTMQQSIGAGFDLLVDPNSARKHVGNRFEELIKVIFTAIGISNKRTVLQIPYHTNEGVKTYKCENDLILSPFNKVKSTNKHLDEKEIVVSIKTTSKDRMGKIFIDKILLERFVKHDQKIIGIFLNDVQRKADNNISYTLVSGLFMVYTKFLTELDGVYYLDPPPNASKIAFKNYMKPFSELLAVDIWELLSP